MTLKLDGSIQKISNFAILALACGAAATDPTGMSASVLAPASANALIAGGDVLASISDKKCVERCQQSVQNVKKKIKKRLDKNIPSYAEQHIAATKAIEDLDNYIGDCFPTTDTIVRLNIDPHKVGIALLKELSGRSEKILAPTGERICPSEMDFANEVVHSIIIESLSGILEDQRLIQMLTPVIARESLDRLGVVISIGTEILCGQNALMSHLAQQELKIAEVRALAAEQISFSARIFALNQYADKASLQIRGSNKELSEIDQAVNVLVSSI